MQRLPTSLGCVWLACFTTLARAQPERATPTPQVEGAQLTPPSLQHFVQASYPAAALDIGAHAEVDLVIDIDPTGAVTAVRVGSVDVGDGAEPHADAFAAAAHEAARDFRFEPARRGQTPVPARIGYRYVFEPPPTAPPASEAEPPEDAPAPPPAPPEAPEPGGAPAEYGATAATDAPDGSVTARQVPKQDVQQMAGTRGDALRAVELMPGVGRAPLGEGALVVRGAGPQDTQVMLDGAPVLQLYHFGGVTSFFNSQLLDTLEFLPGNFSVRYGRAIGGVVDVTVRDPRRDRFHGMLDVNVFDASVLAEGPLGERGAVAVAARRSWIDAIFDKVVPDDAFDVVAAPVYYDYQAIVTADLSPRDQLRVMGYGSRDEMKLVLSEPTDEDPQLRGDISGVVQFHRAETRWRHRYSADTRHEITLGVGWMEWDVALGTLVQQHIVGPRFYGRAEWQVGLGDHASLRFGGDYYTLAADVRYRGAPWVQDSAVQDGQHIEVDEFVAVHRPSGYLETVLTPTQAWTLIPGVRVDYTSDADAWTVDPRLASRYRFERGTTLKAAVGWFHQPPDLGSHIEDFANPRIRPSHALHSSLGLEQETDVDLSFGIEGYYKKLYRLPMDTIDHEAPFVINEGEGRIYGGEVFARYSGSRLFGYASYTLSRSERRRRGSRDYFAFDYDQPHILTFSSGARWPTGWELSGTFRLVSGTPYTPVVSGLYNADTGTYVGVDGARNAGRNDLFHRLDLRLLKRWRVGRGAFSVYLDVQNVYNQRPAEDVSHSFDYRERDTIAGLPILPSLGLRGEL